MELLLFVEGVSADCYSPVIFLSLFLAGPSVSPPPPSAEISVQSKDDLKALMHVRKLLSGENIGIDRKAFLGFIEGEAIVVSTSELCTVQQV